MANSTIHYLIRTEDLVIGYLKKNTASIVASNLNIKCEQGKLIGLVGANGIGKSTLIRTLTNMQRPLEGSVFINSKKLTHYNRTELAQKLSLVLTEPIMSKNLTVLEMVALGRQPYTNWLGELLPLDKQIINRALSQTGINSLQHNKCFELSDGQLQQALIARALAQDTDLIILDEPTTHLDVYNKVQILKLLKTLVEQSKKTILFSTHDIELAIQLCHKMIVMTERKTYFNTPENLIAQNLFNYLFPKDTVLFNKKIGRFEIIK